jgi:hypothetical protein
VSWCVPFLIEFYIGVRGDMFRQVKEEDFSRDEIKAIVNKLKTLKGIGLANTVSDGLVLFHYNAAVFDALQKQDERFQFLQEEENIKYVKFNKVKRLNDVNKLESLRLISLPFNDLVKANKKAKIKYIHRPIVPVLVDKHSGVILN